MSGSTSATGINNQNQIVGHDNGFNGVFYSAIGGRISAFRAPGTVFPDVTLPATVTVTSKINDSGTVVGWKKENNSYPPQGFVMSAGGAFTAITAPNGEFADLVDGLAINNHGDLIGISTSDSRSWLLSDGTATMVNVPVTGVSSVTEVADNNDLGHRVGRYLGLDGLRHGYLQTGPTMADVTNIDCPFAAPGQTYPTGLNNRGEVVGWYTNTTDVGTTFRHGFLWKAGVFTPLDYQGLNPQGFNGRDTVPNDINDAGWVVGHTSESTTGGGFIGGHAWLAIPDAPPVAVAPQTTASRSIAPNGNGWNNDNVTITLEAVDNDGSSGVQSLVYSLAGAQGGGATVAGATAAIVISAEGTTTLTYHAIDVDGNVEPDQSVVVSIDKTPPVVAYQPNLTAPATAGGTVVVFNPSATDAPSGIIAVTSAPFSSGMRFPAGTTTVQLTALDSAGNSAVASFTVTIVPSAPIVTVTGGAFVADGNAHPATAIARDSTGTAVAGTFNISYAPGNTAPSAPGNYSASAVFASSDPGITSAAPWTTMAPNPNLTFNPAVAEINGRIYVHGFDQGSFVPRLGIYDPATNTWTTGAAPSVIRAFASAGVIDGKMYVVGGCIMSDCRIGITNALEIYDPATDTWSTGAPMLTGRLGAAAGVVDGKLIVTGGTLACGPCVPTSATEVYDPVSNSWTARSPIPVSRELATGTVVNGLLYVMGGYWRDPLTLLGGPTGRVDVYDPVANSWTQRPSMPAARYAAAAGLINGEIHVVGGYGPPYLAITETYNVQGNAWFDGPPMPTARTYSAGAVVNSRMYVVGGVNGAILGTTEVFDPSLTAHIVITAPVSPNHAPVAHAGGPYLGELGSAVTLSGAGSSDPDPADSLVQYAWTVGGTLALSGAAPVITAAQLATLGVGSHNVLLTVADTFGATSSASTTLSIYNNVPTAAFTAGPNPAACGQFLTFDGSASGAGRPDRAIVNYAWNFGDGSPVASGGSAIVNHSYAGFGTYGATLTVTDNNVPAQTAATSVLVNVNQGNQAPFANAGGPYSADSGTSLQLSGGLSSDPNTSCGDSIGSHSWTIGGTLQLSGAAPLITAAQLATIGVGSHNVLLTVTDTFGATSSASTTLSIYNNVPTAAFTVGPNPAACGQPLTFNGSASGAGRPDRAIVNYAWTFGDGTPGAGGGAAMVNHAYAAFGAYTATLTVTDNNVPAKTAAASVVVNVNQGNFAPFANAGGPYTVNSGGSLSLNGTLSSDSNAACGDSIVSYVWTIDGSIQLSGPTPTLDTSITPLSSGDHTVSLRVTDTFGAMATSSTTINVQRQLVSISVAPSSVTLSPGQNQTFQAIGHYSDGTEQVLPSGSGGGGGGGSFNGPNPPIWEIEFISNLELSACATAQYPAPISFSIQNFLDRQGAIDETWSVGTPVMSVHGAINAAAVSLTVACTNGQAAGTVNALWTGTRYEGTFTFNGGASTGAVSITGWSAKAPMPVARFSHVAATVNGMVYTMGGGNPDGWPSAIDAYNPATNTWTMVGQMVTPREGAGAAAVNGKIYVVGGNVAGGIPSALIEAYDPATNSWAIGLTPMPTPRAHLVVVTDGTFIYAIGGDTAPNNGGMVSTVERYDPSSNSWSTLASMPSPGSFIAAGFLGGNIIVTGSGGNNSSATDVYSVAANTWRAGPPMPAGRALAAAGVANGGLYLVGGTVNGQPAPEAWVYYPASPGRAEVWSYVSEMRIARSQAAAAVVGDVIYLVGGMDPNSNPMVVMAANEALSTPPVNTFAPAGAFTGNTGGGSSPPSVQWQSTNVTVAGVDGSGNAHANAVGFTTIVASTSDGMSCTTTNTCGALTVADTQAPNLGLPNNQTRQATGPSGALVTYSVSANDNVDGSRPVTCNPVSGSTFALGTTTVTCSASDSSGNTATGVFTITVEDTNPPFMNTPSGTQTRQATSPSGALVTYTASANDSVDGPRPVTCTPPSGSQFPFGSTAVTCTASDTRGNTATRSFTILVQDTNAPFLNVPFQPLNERATSAAGAVVTFGQSVSASDSVDGSITPVCIRPSGSLFPIGSTSVSCQATDAHGNQSPAKTFTVMVTDEPVVTVPSNISAEATSAAGAAVPFAASASTFLGGVAPVQCFIITGFIDGDVQLGGPAASGDMFAMGTTTVGCLAGDGGEMFTITVADTLSPLVRVVTPGADDLIPTSPSTVVVEVEVIEAVAVTAVKINGVDATAVGTTAAGSLWRTNVAAVGGVALTIAATATDDTGHTGAASLVIDNDGIAGAIDRARISGADQRTVYSSEFNDGTTAGMIQRLSGRVTARQQGASIAIGLAGPGQAQVSACTGNVKYVLLDTAGESADVSCGPTGTITVTAHTPDKIDVYKMTPEAIAFAQMRCFFLPMGLRYGGACSASPTPVSFYYSYRVALRDGQTASTGSPVTASADNTGPIDVTLLQIDDQGNEFPVGSFELDPGESADISVTRGAGREDQIVFLVLKGTVTVTIGGVVQTVVEGGQVTVTSDLTAPTVALSSAAPEPTSGSPIPVSIVFSEPVVDFDPALLVMTNATVAGFSGTGAVYAVNLLPLAPGPVTLMLPAHAVTDAAGMGNTASAVLARTFTWAPPVVTTSGDVTVEAVSAGGAAVSFSTTGVDAANEATAVTCSAESGSLFPIGATIVTCSSTDRYGNTGTASLTVTIRDTTAPTIAGAVPSQASLWPPNHAMMPITVAVSASDTVDAATVCMVVGVSSNEAVNGLGDGDTGPDWALPGGLSVTLRAERAGNGSGRVYTIGIACADGSGNRSTTTTHVTVAGGAGKPKE